MSDGTTSYGAVTGAHFAMLERYPKRILWREVPVSDQNSARALRAQLSAYARQLVKDLKSAPALKDFASQTAPNGRISTDYWGCVYPAQAANKSYAFQLFFIISATGLELGFCLGAAWSQVKDGDERAGLEESLRSAQKALLGLKDREDLAQLVTDARASGYELRSSWRRGPDSTGDYVTFRDWAEFAASDKGSKAAISKHMSKDEVAALGEGLYPLLYAELSRFQPLLEAIYTSPNVAAELETKKGASTAFDQLLERTLWPDEALNDLIASLESTGQIALAGPPGTGKTWVAEALAEYLTEGRPEGVRVVQFHPSTSYEQFIEGLMPTVDDHGRIEFKPVKGVVLSMAHDAATSRRVLVIDEMNRANLPRVLGELMYLFEYRDKEIDLQYSQGFRLPKDLLFVGTMNTADRSIRSIDVALRRRFDIFECPPDVEILERYYEPHRGRTNKLGDELYEGFLKLNEALAQALDRHHTIGHTFFMKNVLTAESIEHAWTHKIGPLIDEYFFDQPSLASDFSPQAFWPSLA